MAVHQHQRLLVHRGMLDYWRPVVLAAPLATAMRSLGSSMHYEAAARMELEFGSVPGTVPPGAQDLVDALRLAMTRKGGVNDDPV